MPQLTERKRGIFYRGSRAFIHFHEDPAGMFADARLTENFDRFDITTTAKQKAFVKALRDHL